MMQKSTKQYHGLGQVPIGIGAVLKGWDLTTEEYRNPNMLPVVDFRAMTNKCYHNCDRCFTDKNKKTLTLPEIKYVIDQLAELNTHTIDYLGEGEPTLDKDFFEIIEYTQKKRIQPVIFTDAATRMLNKDFVKRVYDSGASVVPKCDSLFNAEYQNDIVKDKTGKYFSKRNQAIELLMEQGFNAVMQDGTTRMGFDIVLSKKNMNEIEQTLDYCRKNNLWAIWSFDLPAGRSGSQDFDKSLMINEEEKKIVRSTVRTVDERYGFIHPILNNFMTTSCIEFMQIYGDGRVSPCPGNEKVLGNVKVDSIKELEQRILEKFPCHNRLRFDGNCLYREKF